MDARGNSVWISGDADREMSDSGWSGPRRTPRRGQRPLAWRVPYSGSASRPTAAPRPDPADARDDGRIAMSKTKVREPLELSPLDDEPASENLPEPVPLTLDNHFGVRPMHARQPSGTRTRCYVA